jgi:hypothetical protein
MKITLFNWLFMAFCITIATPLKAQMTMEKVKNGQYGTPQERAAEIDKAMQKGLNLNEQQMPKIRDINLRYAIRTENEVAKAPLSSWSKYWKIKAIQDDKDKELKPVLTAEQFKKYAKKRDELMLEGVKKILF